MKKRIVFLLFFLIILIVGCKKNNDKKDYSKTRVIDNAGLLSKDEITKLENKADELSIKYNCDILILTVDSIDGIDPNKYANDFFTDNGYGLGEYNSGISLLICMGTRDWAVTAHSVKSDIGAQAIFTYDRTDKIGEVIIGNLSVSRYYDAFNDFLRKTEFYLALNDEKNKWYESYWISTITQSYYGRYECSEFSSFGIDLFINIYENECNINKRNYAETITENGNIKLINGKIIIEFDDGEIIGKLKDGNMIVVNFSGGDEDYIFLKQ